MLFRAALEIPAAAIIRKGENHTSLFITILFFAMGILFVVKGGDYFVESASWIAEISGIPKIIIGATIVSIATTLPEMLVSVMAAYQGKTDMSISNAIGSVTANIGLIMAVSLIFMPGIIKRRDYLIKSVLMLSAALIIVICGFCGKIDIVPSVLMLLIFASFIAENIMGAEKTAASKDLTKESNSLKDRKTVLFNIAKFAAGAVGILWGAQLLVDNGSELARLAGVSERIIGITLVAVGTSLPELITTITAIVKKQSDLSVGNILGANIIDLTLIMPLSALISGRPIPVSAASALIDLPACLIVGLTAVVPAMISSRFSRHQGFILLALYACYAAVTCFIV